MATEIVSNWRVCTTGCACFVNARRDLDTQELGMGHGWMMGGDVGGKGGGWMDGGMDGWEL